MHQHPRGLHKHTVITHLFVQQFVHLLRPSLDRNILTHICSWSQPLVLLLYLVPKSLPPLHSLMLALTHSVFFSPIVPSHTHFLFFSCSTASHSLPFINPPDDTVAHLASVFILHNSLWLGLLSPSLYRLPPPIPIKDLRAPLSANQVVIRAAKIRGLINKGLSLLASGSLCLNR